PDRHTGRRPPRGSHGKAPLAAMLPRFFCATNRLMDVFPDGGLAMSGNGFAEIVDHLRAFHLFTREEPAGVGFEEHGHRRRVSAAGEELVLMVEIGAPVATLRQNAAPIIGALDEVNGATVLRHRVPLAAVTPADLHRLLHVMLGAAIGL